MADKALVPVVQKEVIFYEDVITAVQVTVNEQEQIYVPVRPICEYLGLDWSAQYRRINRDPVLSDVIQGVAITTTPSSDGRGGGLQEMSCLPLKFLPGWLFGVSANRVKSEMREKIIRYQRESYDVLWEAFQEGRLTADVSFDELLEQASSDVVEAYQIAQAIMKLARNQIMLDARLDDHSRTLEDYGRRLETIEADMHQEDRYISENQATQISQAIKAIAIALGKQTGRNEFGATWGEFYRKFGIAKYRYLPVSKFDEAMAWLNEFYQSLTGETPF